MKKIFKHEIIEVVIPKGNTQTQIMIPDQPNLRSVKITGINFYYGNQDGETDGTVPTSPISQLPVIDVKKLNKVFLTLLDFTNFEFLKLAPAPTLNTLLGEEKGRYENNAAQFTGQIVNYPKSYITLSQQISDPVNDTVVLFSVYYVDRNQTTSTPYSKKS